MNIHQQASCILWLDILLLYLAELVEFIKISWFPGTDTF